MDELNYLHCMTQDALQGMCGRGVRVRCRPHCPVTVSRCMPLFLPIILFVVAQGLALVEWNCREAKAHGM